MRKNAKASRRERTPKDANDSQRQQGFLGEEMAKWMAKWRCPRRPTKCSSQRWSLSSTLAHHHHQRQKRCQKLSWKHYTSKLGKQCYVILIDSCTYSSYFLFVRSPLYLHIHEGSGGRQERQKRQGRERERSERKKRLAKNKASPKKAPNASSSAQKIIYLIKIIVTWR